MKKLFLILLLFPIIGFGQRIAVADCNYIYYSDNTEAEGVLTKEFKNGIEVRLIVWKSDLSSQSYLENNGYLLLEGMHTRGNYVGEFKDGKYDGQGTLRNRDKYIGGFKHGEYHGQGTYFWEDGTKYVGEWMNNQINGQGIKTYSAGGIRKYEGEWKENTWDGNGVAIYASGEIKKGRWKNNILVGEWEEIPSVSSPDPKVNTSEKVINDWRNWKF